MDRPAIDLDLLWADDDPPWPVRAFGETFLLPPTRPAGLVLMLHRARRERGPDTAMTWDEMEAAARFLLGVERWEAWLHEHRVTEGRLQSFVLNVIAEYHRREQAERGDPPGEARGASEAPTT